MHCSLPDFAKFISFVLNGCCGDHCELVTKETFQKIQRGHVRISNSDAYGLGWCVTERGWGGGKVLTHQGSNTMWYTTVWIAPKKHTALIIVTNVGGDIGVKATDEIAAFLTKYC